MMLCQCHPKFGQKTFVGLAIMRLSVSLSACPSAWLPLCQAVCLRVCLSDRLFATFCLSNCPSVRLSVHLLVGKL